MRLSAAVHVLFSSDDNLIEGDEPVSIRCNVFHQNTDEIVDYLCSNSNSTIADNCTSSLNNQITTMRDDFYNDYESNKEFNFVRMGIWKYKNVTWLRHDLTPHTPFAYRQIYIAELCEMFIDSSVEIPQDILQMAVDYPSDEPLNCSEVFIPPSLPIQSLQSLPSLHVLLVTAGQRPHLFGMLASLQEMESSDFVTILLDMGGDDTSVENDEGDEDHNNGSNYVLDVAAMESYARSVLRCQVAVVRLREGSDRLGFWGHAARNRYSEELRGGDFVWHLDDDNVVLPGAVPAIKQAILADGDAHALHIFSCWKVTISSTGDPSDEELPRLQGVLALGNVDTASGLVPSAANRMGHWGLHYGGDWAFHESLLPIVSRVVFHRVFTFRYLLSSRYEEEKDEDEVEGQQ
eukprot:CAMPEP_0170071338 /NCGR_PEP_ID=MMETSP0019_2-20121128/9310_1 /TAXON_ID=98059 /ORGANISM="Dinobryon sp., Strain UTEXLB2267" /LENGTH=404 /DNA_ID=CAMNT_0010279877 /DNA_START=79 /DNA_END=1293 /DNA_ORIENTATION=-